MRRPLLSGRGFIWAAVLLGLLVAFPRVSSAQRRWLKLDRVEAESTWVKGMVRVRAYVSAVNIYGGTIPIGGKKKAWRLQVGGKKLRNPSFAVPFSTQQDDVFLLGIVIQTSKEKPVDKSQPHSLTEIKPAAVNFIEGLPKTTRFALVTYAEQLKGGRLDSLTNVTTRLRKLGPSKSPQANLTKAVRHAIKTINKYRPKGTKKGLRVRKAIVIIGDGRDSQWPDPKAPAYDAAKEQAKRLGKLADRSGIRIHAIGYSAENWRRPMLMLGELTKRTHGTMRLATSYDSFEVSLRGLSRELLRQHVVTFYVPEKRVKGRKIQISSGELVSNVIRLKKIKCGDAVCSADEYCSTECVPRNITSGSSILTWVMYIGGGIAGLLVLLMGLGFLLSKREQRQQQASIDPGPPAEQPQAPAPGHGAIQPAANPYGDPSAQGGQPQGQQHGHRQQHGHQQQHGQQQQHAIQPAANPYAAQQPQMTPGQANRPARRSHLSVSGPTLLVIKGEQQGQQFTLKHNFRIGKAGHSDLAIPNDPYASTDHAYIQMDRAGNCTLVDNQSTNGTFVNGVRVSQRKLTSGMAVRIGATEMRFLTQ